MKRNALSTLLIVDAQSTMGTDTARPRVMGAGTKVMGTKRRMALGTQGAAGMPHAVVVSATGRMDRQKVLQAVRRGAR